jgi:hypothetical protein
VALAAIKRKIVYAKNSDLNDLSLINLDIDHDMLSHEKILVPVTTHGHSTSNIKRKQESHRQAQKSKV